MPADMDSDDVTLIVVEFLLLFYIVFILGMFECLKPVYMSFVHTTILVNFMHLQDVTVIAENGKGTRQWWELKESKMLYNMAITYRDDIRSQYKGTKAIAKRDKAWEAIVSKLWRNYFNIITFNLMDTMCK